MKRAPIIKLLEPTLILLDKTNCDQAQCLLHSIFDSIESLNFNINDLEFKAICLFLSQMYKYTEVTSEDSNLLKNLVSICYNLNFHKYEECIPAICDLLYCFSSQKHTTYFLETQISEYVFFVLDSCLQQSESTDQVLKILDAIISDYT